MSPVDTTTDGWVGAGEYAFPRETLMLVVLTHFTGKDLA